MILFIRNAYSPFSERRLLLRYIYREISRFLGLMGLGFVAHASLAQKVLKRSETVRNRLPRLE